ncbi:MAG TPA: hypothetical protein VGM38_02490 [Pseudolysinimonas sp.]
MTWLTFKTPRTDGRDDEAVRRIISHALLWGRGSYEAPDKWAAAILKRLDFEGYEVMPKKR